MDRRRVDALTPIVAETRDERKQRKQTTLRAPNDVLPGFRFAQGLIHPRTAAI